jgi:hypothetical protein
MQGITPQRAFELGALAMKQLALAKCGNLTESLQEGIMTDAGLSRADKDAMDWQIDAINEVEKDIRSETSAKAAHYGSYIFGETVKSQIRELFPDATWPTLKAPPRETEMETSCYTIGL